MSATGSWMADFDSGTDDGWQPILRTGRDHVELGIWFPSRADCETWITENVLGASLSKLVEREAAS